MMIDGGVIERLASARDIGAIEAALAVAGDRFGFDSYAYFVSKPPEGRRPAREITTYRADWRSRYAQQRYYYLDPVLRRAGATVLPVDWQRLRAATSLSAQQAAIFEEATDFRLRAGMTIPIHGPHGGMSCFSFATDRAAASATASAWASAEGDLMRLAFAAHEALLRADSGADPTPTLSARERECLSWTAGGKTSWEISQVLGISDETVVFHLKNAMRKLGVHSKHHAVVKAITLNLIAI